VSMHARRALTKSLGSRPVDAGLRVVRRQETAGPVVEALARVAVVDWATVLRSIEDALASDLGRAEKAVQIAELVRQAGSYRWSGCIR
jgi:hypothetical protein